MSANYLLKNGLFEYLRNGCLVTWKAVPLVTPPCGRDGLCLEAARLHPHPTCSNQGNKCLQNLSNINASQE